MIHTKVAVSVEIQFPKSPEQAVTTIAGQGKLDNALLQLTLSNWTVAVVDTLFLPSADVSVTIPIQADTSGP
jgi:hypothetical protein